MSENKQKLGIVARAATNDFKRDLDARATRWVDHHWPEIERKVLFISNQGYNSAYFTMDEFAKRKDLYECLRLQDITEQLCQKCADENLRITLDNDTSFSGDSFTIYW